MGKPRCSRKEVESEDHVDMEPRKGPWTPEEDLALTQYIERNGGRHGNWRRLPKLAGLDRCGKSCRLRWCNYLSPNIKRGAFTSDEDTLIIDLHSILGNKWAAIAKQLPGRTDNETKNYWNTHLRKQLMAMGIDPVTHLPCPPILPASTGSATANLLDLVMLQQADAANHHHLLQDAMTKLFCPSSLPLGASFPDPSLFSNLGATFVPHGGTNGSGNFNSMVHPQALIGMAPVASYPCFVGNVPAIAGDGEPDSTALGQDEVASGVKLTVPIARDGPTVPSATADTACSSSATVSCCHLEDMNYLELDNDADDDNDDGGWNELLV